nr:unknown [Novosphingobium aromaticivorans]
MLGFWLGGGLMRMQRLLIDRSTLDLITSDARDFLNVLNAAGLLKASALMQGVLEQLASDRNRLPEDSDKTGTN